MWPPSWYWCACSSRGDLVYHHATASLHAGCTGWLWYAQLLYFYTTFYSIVYFIVSGSIVGKCRTLMLSRTYLITLCVADYVALLPCLAFMSFSVRSFHKVVWRIPPHLILQASITIGALIFRYPNGLRQNKVRMFVLYLVDGIIVTKYLLILPWPVSPNGGVTRELSHWNWLIVHITQPMWLSVTKLYKLSWWQCCAPLTLYNAYGYAWPCLWDLVFLKFWLYLYLLFFDTTPINCDVWSDLGKQGDCNKRFGNEVGED